MKTQRQNTKNRSFSLIIVIGLALLFSTGCSFGFELGTSKAAMGKSCSSGEDCQSGLCITDKRGSTYCSEKCDGDCRDGYVCGRLQEGGGACAKTQEARKDLGEFCSVGGDCKSGLCLTDGTGASYCSETCDIYCSSGYQCIPLQGGGKACGKNPGE